MEQCNRAFVTFRTDFNQCKRLLKNAKSNYVHLVQTKVENKKLSYCEFSNCHFLQMFLKLSNPCQISLKLFAMSFASNSMLDNKGHPLHDPPPLHTEQNSILAHEVSRLFNSLDSMKSIGLYKIPLIVLKNLGS